MLKLVDSLAVIFEIGSSSDFLCDTFFVNNYGGVLRDKLTVYFEELFWGDIIECVEDGKLFVIKVTFI